MPLSEGTLADQWEEFFYCDAMEKDVMVTKGKKRTTSRSSNTKGNDNIISNGSVVAVADGQCMMIVEQDYTRDELDSQLKTEFISALQPGQFGRLRQNWRFNHA